MRPHRADLVRQQNILRPETMRTINLSRSTAFALTLACSSLAYTADEPQPHDSAIPVWLDTVVDDSAKDHCNYPPRQDSDFDGSTCLIGGRGGLNGALDNLSNFEQRALRTRTGIYMQGNHSRPLNCAPDYKRGDRRLLTLTTSAQSKSALGNSHRVNTATETDAASVSC